jgi:hypothetical protein
MQQQQYSTATHFLYFWIFTPLVLANPGRLTGLKNFISLA